ncbi:MAG: tetratricopeptide repeat protein [Planctomycetota bacterium]|jgi:serine/threonine protein kinase
MTPAREPSAKEIFSQAADLPDDQRAAFVDDACQGNPQLREMVESLLKAHESAGHFLADPSLSDDQSTSSLSLPKDLKPGETIGQFTIETKLGEGGFGTVYLAHQQQPVERTVAIKILKPGMDSRQVLARFDAERQTLARMDHPGVAHVYDAGTTPAGRPYVVMEHVQGAPITRQCDENDLTIRERLELFEKVCRSVQHAHNKGVMHRDLKPANVLVTCIDGVAHPKIIDFGIAKAVEGRPEDHTLQTQAQQLLGTPAYMSPEQISLDPDSVDTRTDVYSLGVLLYELLTGQTPFDQHTFRSASLTEIQRIIRNTPPPRPSAAVGSGVETQDRNEHAVRVLKRQLAGELDWIVLRALEKDPSRRYQTADALADDIERYLRDEPIEARPPSRVYNLSKLITRHKFESASAAILAVVLVLSAIFSIHYANRAKRAKEEAVVAYQQAEQAQFAAYDARSEALDARDKAQLELQKFESIATFTKSMLGGVDPAIARGMDTELLTTMLDAAAVRLDTQQDLLPEVEHDLRITIAEIYRKASRLDEAELQFRTALELVEIEFGPDHDFTIATTSDLGMVLMQQTRFDESRELLERAAATAHDEFGSDSLLTLKSESNLAKLYAEIGETDRAVELHTRVLEEYIKHYGYEHESTMAQRNSLAHIYDQPEDITKAVELYNIVIPWQKKNLGEDHPNTLATMNNLADSYMHTDQWDLAEPILIEVIEHKIRIFPEGHISLITSMNNLATVYNRTERYELAEPIYLDLLEQSEQSLGPNNMRTLILMNNLGSVYRNQNRFAEAIQMVRPLLTRFTEIAGETHPNTVMVGGNLAALYLSNEQYEDGISQIESTITLSEEVFGADSWQHASYLKTKGQILLGMDQTQQAIPVLQQALEDYIRLYGEDDERTQTIREILSDNIGQSNAS